MDSRIPQLSVIIPAYNEAERLPRTLTSVSEFLQKQSFASEVLVVTDGSRDNTANAARAFHNRFDRLRVLEFDSNRGKGFAVKEGMLAASGTFRLFMDADNAVPVDYATSFLERMIAERLDVLIGSRSAKGARFEKHQPFIRQQLAQVFGQLQHVVLGIPFMDTQCGFKMFTAKAAMRLFTKLHYECSYFDAELLYIAHKSDARIGESGIVWRHDDETRLPIGQDAVSIWSRNCLRSKRCTKT